MQSRDAPRTAPRAGDGESIAAHHSSRASARRAGRRRHLEARALVQLGREDAAIKLLGRDATRKAELIRSEIHWRRNKWGKVAASMESILGERWQAETPLDEIEQTQVLRLAVSLTFENNRAGLDTLRRRSQDSLFRILNDNRSESPFRSRIR